MYHIANLSADNNFEITLIHKYRIEINQNIIRQKGVFFQSRKIVDQLVLPTSTKSSKMKMMNS